MLWNEMSNKLLKSKDVCQTLGISSSSLRLWESQGKIKAIRTPGGQRLYDLSTFNKDFVPKQKTLSSDKSTIFYARVSSAKQRNDLIRQQEFIRTNYSDKCSKSIEITDIGSGLNFKRQGLLRVLGLIKKGEVSKVVVASRDRLARFGYELIQWFCKEFETEILVLNTEDHTPEEELGSDLMSIVQVYCCRWNGKRRYKASKGEESKTETPTNEGTEN